MMVNILLGATLAAILLFGSFILMATGDIQTRQKRVESMLRVVLEEMDLLEEWHLEGSRQEQKRKEQERLSMVARHRATGY